MVSVLVIYRGVSPDASIGTPFLILPALTRDLPLVAFALPVPLPDAEGAFGRASLCCGACPVCSCPGPGFVILDRMWEAGGPCLVGSEISLTIVVIWCTVFRVEQRIFVVPLDRHDLLLFFTVFRSSPPQGRTSWSLFLSVEEVNCRP